MTFMIRNVKNVSISFFYDHKQVLPYFAVEPLQQEPEAPFQNATSRDWQKAFNPQRELGAFCSGVKIPLTHKIILHILSNVKTNYIN